MLVICRQGTNEFFVQVQPPASQREPIPYRIRWFATLADEQKAQAPPNPDPIPVPDLLAIDPRLARNAILAAASDIDGMRGAEIAKRLRLRPDELRPILVELGQRNFLNYDANGDAIRLR
jgi:hypothetical protein